MVRLLAWIALSLSIERNSTMTEGSGGKDASRTFDDQDRARGQDWLGDLGQEERRELMTWVGQNLTEVRQTALGQRPVYWILWLGLALGLAAYVAGYLIKASTPTEPVGLVGDLLYTFGWALWTGVVVVVFLQIIPETKRRQYKRALDAYEASLREEAGAGSEEAPAECCRGFWFLAAALPGIHCDGAYVESAPCRAAQKCSCSVRMTARASSGPEPPTRSVPRWTILSRSLLRTNRRQLAQQSQASSARTSSAERTKVRKSGPSNHATTGRVLQKLHPASIGRTLAPANGSSPAFQLAVPTRHHARRGSRG